MSDSVELFYDELSEEYHLLLSNWDEVVKGQGETLNQILLSYVQRNQLDILDCSCGIGTQAIGLALKGHQVFASDLSSRAVERAKMEAKRFGLNMRFGVSDFRALKAQIPGDFDVVVSCDNSIPHLLTQADLRLAFENMYGKLRTNGMILVSIRDYDLLQKESPSGMAPRKIQDKNGTRIYMQTWDWNNLRDSYEVELFLMKQTDSAWSTTSYKTTYRAWLRGEVSAALVGVGFQDIQWLMPEETGYYQPIVIARH